jgi:hypothetical protein
LGQLLLRRRAARVERGHQHLLAVAGLEAERDLGAGRGLAGALQTDHQDRQRGRGIQRQSRRPATAQHLDQMVMDDLDHHLRGGDALQHLLADGALANRADEVLDDRQRDIRLKQRHAHFAQSRVDVLLGEGAAAAQAIEDFAKLG